MSKPTHELSIIVLAGGFGTRIRESIGDIPKILAPIKDKLFIDYFLAWIKPLLILQDTNNKVTTETSNSWSKYQSSKSVLDATKAQLKAAEIANEGITLEYDSGNTRSTLEVIQSRSLLLEARIDFAKAERDYMISQFELAEQLGTLSVKSLN